jgi:RpiB/LacA/LacB family sugar-phosphate isomerase
MKIPSDAELQAIVKKVINNYEKHKVSSSRPLQTPSQQSLTPISMENRKVAIGADHGGIGMKELLITHLKNQGYEVIDCGTNSSDAVDYPDFASAVGVKVANKHAWRGIMIDGAGIGSCMAANKVSGVRAAMCYDLSSANNAREHNNANVLTLGAGLIGSSLAKQITDTFLNTEFGGGRHAKRVNKIMDLENRR